MLRENLTKLILLLSVLLLAFTLRFYRIVEIPTSLNWDEVSISYNAYSILKTGKDEWGKLLPIHFRSYGEYKLPVQIYFSIPGIYFFGLNEFGVRITPVIYGTLTTLFIYFLGKELFKSSSTGLLSAAFLAISPWHIHLTRASFESSFAVFWVVFGTWLLIKGFSKPKFLIWSMIPFSLSLYTYNSARIFTPIFLFVVFLIFRKYFFTFKKYFLLSVLLFLFLILPMVPYYLSGEGASRYKLVSVTDDPGLILRINETRGNSNLPDPLPRLFYNKVTFVGSVVLTNYIAHFTPNFLFLSGAPHKQHHVQNIGELYFFQLPLLFLGLYFLFKSKQFFKWLIITWLLVSFIPVSVTNDSIPHALRTLIAVPTYQLICAFGLDKVFLFFRKKKINFLLFIIPLLLLAFIQFIYYLYNYYQIYPRNYSKDWQYGYKQVVEFINDHQSEYDKIVFTRHYGEPHMFTLFFLNYDPAKYQSNPNLNRFETYDWVRVLEFDKFYFPDLGDKGTRFQDIISQDPNKKYLFIGKSGDFPPEQTRLKTIDFLNGDRGFEIVEKK